MAVSRIGVAVLVGDPRGVVVIWSDPDSDVRVEATPTVDSEGRVHFAEVRVRGAVVGSDELRRVPVTSMLSRANGAYLREILHVLADLDRPGAVEAYDALPPEPEVEVVPAAKRRPTLRFRVTEGRKPNAFYASVAAAYKWLVEEEGSRRPAVDLAETNGVPVTTVHRWIREARRRGFIRSGVRGRAGL